MRRLSHSQFPPSASDLSADAVLQGPHGVEVLRPRADPNTKRRRRADAFPVEKVEQIRGLRTQGMTLKAIASQVGCSKGTVLQYVRGVESPVEGRSWQSFQGKGREILPSPITIRNDGTALVTLTRGLFALIDADDIEKVSSRRWLATPGRSARETFYARSGSGGRSVFMHSLILPVREGMVVDHIDRDTLNNRRSNLREASLSGNGSNRTPIKNRSGFVGVTFHKPSGRWNAHVMKDRKQHSAGYFDLPEEAARARDALALRLQGEFAVLNFQEARP